MDKMSNMTIHSINITSLSMELLTSVSTHLSREDLRNARLVSHQFDKAVQSTLFQTFFLRLNMQSFEKLKNIAAHNNFRRHVRVISFDPTLVMNGYSREHYLAFLRSMASQDSEYGWSIGTARSWLGQVPFSEDENDNHYRKYREFITGQDNLMEFSNWKQLFRSAITNFPGLSEIQYRGRRPHDLLVRETVDKFASSPTRTASFYFLGQRDQPQSYESNRIFFTLLDLAYGKGVTARVKDISGAELDAVLWEIHAAKLDPRFAGANNIQKLSLHFKNQLKNCEGIETNLARVIAGATLLRSLRLTFSHNSLGILAQHEYPPMRRYKKVYLHEIETNISSLLTVQWMHLKDLDLYGIKTTEEDLRDLIPKRAPNLRRLELNHTILTLEADSSEYDRELALQLIQSIIPLTKLEAIIFDHVSTSRQDHWYIQGRQEGCKHKYDMDSFCGCPQPRHSSSLGHSDSESDEGQSIWIFGDLTGWFDGQCRVVCACTRRPAQRPAWEITKEVPQMNVKFRGEDRV